MAKAFEEPIGAIAILEAVQACLRAYAPLVFLCRSYVLIALPFELKHTTCAAHHVARVPKTEASKG